MSNIVATEPKGYSMKQIVAMPRMIEKAKNLLAEGGASFLSSVLDMYNSDKLLAKCDPQDVMQECWKAAALKLPVQKSLGYAYIIPYGDKPQFQLGYRGLIQLAMRSGQYKFLNAGFVYEGETVNEDRLSGMIEFVGEKTSDKAIGYFAYFKLLNGFEKCIYWSKEKVTAHARRYSKSYSYKDSPWQTQFDDMALKTVIKSLISKYGVMSIEFAGTVADDNNVEDEVAQEVAQNGNKEELTIAGSFEPAHEEAHVDHAPDYEEAPF